VSAVKSGFKRVFECVCVRTWLCVCGKALT